MTEFTTEQSSIFKEVLFSVISPNAGQSMSRMKDLYTKTYGIHPDDVGCITYHEMATEIILAAVERHGFFAPEKKRDWWHVAFVLWSVLSTIGGFVFMYFVYRKG